MNGGHVVEITSTKQASDLLYGVSILLFMSFHQIQKTNTVGQTGCCQNVAE